MKIRKHPLYFKWLLEVVVPPAFPFPRLPLKEGEENVNVYVDEGEENV